MQVHPDIVEVLKKEIIPRVIRIHDFDVPWPAELRSGNPFLSDKHKKGVVMFNIVGADYLNAEYFCHDDSRAILLGTGILTMADTRVEIPNRVLELNPKTTGHFGSSTPSMTAYKLQVHGWIGGSVDTTTRAAHMTLLGLPDLNLPHIEPSVSNEDQLVPTVMRQEDTGDYVVSHDPYAIQDVTSKNVIPEMRSGSWSIRLTASSSSFTPDADKLYHATLTRTDGSPFTLSDERIGDALYKFLSFQAGRWITTPTIVCDLGQNDSRMAKFACVGRLTSKSARLPETRQTATTWRRWQDQFGEFLRLYNDPDSHDHLQNAVHHYVEANQILDDASISQALVAAQSTLQALTRWWNELGTGFRFGQRNGPTFEQLLIKAAQTAKLGEDGGAVIDEEALQATIREAAGYRNDIDHGRGGNIAANMRSVFECQMHHQNLARLLILAKLGERGRDHRGRFSGPTFKNAPK